MTVGRKPKPRELHLVDGTFRPDRNNRRGKGPGKLRPTRCPAFLTGDARAEWNRLYPELERLNVAGALDRGVLAAYCIAWADLKAANLELEGRTGPTLWIERLDGGIFEHPAAKARRAASAQIRQLGAELGLSPVSRERVKIDPPEDESADGILD